MKTEIQKVNLNNIPAQYLTAVEKLYEVKEQYSYLIIKNKDDKKGYDEVKDSIKFCVGLRTEIESIRKQMKSSVLVAGREIDSKAKEFTATVSTVEIEQKAKKKVVDDEVTEIKLKKAKEIQDKIDTEQAELDRIDAEHQELASAYWRYENERLEVIKAEQTAKQDRLDAQQEEIDQKEAKLKADQAKVEQDKLDIEYEGYVSAYLKYVDEKLKKEKIAQDKLDAEQSEKDRLKKIADDEKAATDRINAETEAARIGLDREKYLESIKPDIQKIKEFAESLSFLNYPELADKKTAGFMDEYRKKIDNIRVEILEKMEQYK